MRKALIVGNNNYKICPLRACVNDAVAVANILDYNGDSSNNFSTKLCVNVSTKDELLGLIDECFSGDADIALFYFSGHGHVDHIGGNIVTLEYSQYDMGVSMNDILTIISQSRCKNKVVVLDCCHSGMMGQQTTNAGANSIIGEGVTLLTACRSDEGALEVEGHGVFTMLFLEALKGGAADVLGNITLGGIYAYIDKALGPWDQRPVFKTNVKNFSAIRKVVPQVSIGVIRDLCIFFDTPLSEMHLDPSYEPTNTPQVDHRIIAPYANEHNVHAFSELQKLEGIGLVIPCGEDHMYYAAMNSKSCRLTPLGQHYWQLVKRRII